MSTMYSNQLSYTSFNDLQLYHFGLQDASFTTKKRLLYRNDESFARIAWEI